MIHCYMPGLENEGIAENKFSKEIHKTNMQYSFLLKIKQDNLHTKLIVSNICTSPIWLLPGQAKKQLSLLIDSAHRPWGLGGVSRIVCRTFMSRMLWMYKLSSKQTISRCVKKIRHIRIITFNIQFHIYMYQYKFEYMTLH